MVGAQVEQVSKALEAKFPGRRLVFIFDHSPIHRTKADDALNAHNMNVSAAGAQARMRDGWFVDKRGKRHEQSMVDKKGEPIGLRQALIERGLFGEGMHKADMVALLSAQPDFAQQPTLVEELLAKRGHVVLFLPKFHCEMNPVERIWATAKRYTRERCTFKLKSLRGLIPKALCIDTTEIVSYFEHCQAWVTAYSQGLKYAAAKAFVLAGRKERQAKRAQKQPSTRANDSEGSSDSESSDSESIDNESEGSESDSENESEDSSQSEQEQDSENETEQLSESERDSEDESESDEEMAEEKDDSAAAERYKRKRTAAQRSPKASSAAGSRGKRSKPAKNDDAQVPEAAGEVLVVVHAISVCSVTAVVFRSRPDCRISSIQKATVLSVTRLQRCKCCCQLVSSARVSNSWHRFRRLFFALQMLFDRWLS